MQHPPASRHGTLLALCLLTVAAAGCPESDDLLPLTGAAGKAGAGTLPAELPEGGSSAGSVAAQGGAGSPATGSGGAGAAGSAGAAGRSPRRGGAGRVAAGSGGVGGSQPAAVGGQGGRSAAAGSGGKSAVAGSGGAAGGVAGDCVQNLTCQLAAPASTGDAHQDCVDRINQFRTQCACLPALARWNDGEACADMMAQYDSGGTTAHAGFAANICKGGSAQNECPGWGSEAQVVSGCLQQMWNEGPPPSSDCTGSCFQKYGHFINMTNTRMKKVACGFYKTDQGKLWSVQNFSQ